MSYLLIRNLSVQHANMLSSNYALTAAQPLGLTLFAHALGRKTHSTIQDVAVIYHDVQPLGESPVYKPGLNWTPPYEFLPQQRRGATLIDNTDRARESFSNSLQPVATMHMCLSLLMRYEGRAPRRVSDALASMRILGGTIQGFDFDPSQDIDESLEPLLPKIKSGYWLVDRTDLMNSDEPLESMIHALTDRSHSWLVAATLGYALTTEIRTDRSDMRQTLDMDEPYPHAYCEPMLGLAQFVSVRDRANQSPPFWAPKWIQDDVFIVHHPAV